MGLTGAIMGDIAGSMWEFYTDDYDPEDKDNDLYYGPRTKRTTITDDSTLSLAIAEAITSNTFDFEKYLRELAIKYPAMGYGHRFAAWFRDPELKIHSCGNGSAMRVSFCGEVANSLKEAETLAYLSAIPTHDHPEGIKGAIVTAGCIYLAKMRMTKDEILKYAISKYPIDKYKNSPAKTLNEYDHFSFYPTCQEAVPFAIRCFYEYDDFKKMMHFINERPVDSDTIGAIAGSIFESYYGHCLSKEEDTKILIDKIPDDYLYNIYHNAMIALDNEQTYLNCGIYVAKAENENLVEDFFKNFDNYKESDYKDLNMVSAILMSMFSEQQFEIMNKFSIWELFTS